MAFDVRRKAHRVLAHQPLGPRGDGPGSRHASVIADPQLNADVVPAQGPHSARHPTRSGPGPRPERGRPL